MRQTFRGILVLASFLMASCESYPHQIRREWAQRSGLQKNPEQHLSASYRNAPGEEPDTDVNYLLWLTLSDKPSEPTDTVKVQVDPARHALRASLIRAGKEIAAVNHRYDVYEEYLRLHERWYPRFDKFPLIYGWRVPEVTLGKNKTGLVVHQVDTGAGFIVVLYVAAGGGPGYSRTFGPVQ